ncbi:hypothetical protein C0993_004792 [Termitomyces sp. T159_Od127]|nr:hypothetical protein C0993_004792 [Termitomyces sp. T159_Od127]
MLQGGQTIAASLIEHGLLPSALYRPNIAFAIHVIELFHMIHLRCPRLAIQPFVKGLCDLHGVPFKPYLSKQFSIAYNVYLSICEETEKHVQAALDRNTPKWRLRNACPACTYKLAGEKSLVFDMLSGELAKYPLAVVNELLNVFGTHIGGGYDIGCKFGTMIANSPLGPCACQLEYKSLVGSFHRHAHNRRCQLSFLTKYVEGLGLEDLEGCERFFSKSNTLALSVQYASIFHRKQSIQEYAKHMDKQETYATLKKQMKDQGVMSFETFTQWLAEEKAYLEGLSWEPLEETLQMEYYQKLVNLEASQKALDDAQAKWLVITPENHNSRDYTRSTETKRHHVLENHKKDLKIVQDLETKLGVTT